MGRQGFGLRGLTGLLLALNGGVLLVGLCLAYWPGHEVPTLEFNADKVGLLARPDAPSAAARSSTPAGPVTTAPCLLWDKLAADDLETVEATLGSLGLGQGQYDFLLDKPLGWWVYLPPFPDAAALGQAMDAIRARGVTDFAPVRGGSMANALSLGAFPSLAKARLQARLLADKGVAGVRYGPRPGNGPLRLVLVGGTAGAAGEDWPSRLKAELPASLQPGACPGTTP